MVCCTNNWVVSLRDTNKLDIESHTDFRDEFLMLFTSVSALCITVSNTASDLFDSVMLCNVAGLTSRSALHHVRAPLDAPKIHVHAMCSH